MTVAVVEREELERVVKQMQDIAPENKVPADKRGEFDTLNNTRIDLQAKIEAAVKDEERAADLKAAQSFLNDPKRRIDHSADGGDETKRALLKAGWEIKSGMVLAPTSYKGRTVELCPEEVLFGPVPDNDPEAAKYINSFRAVFAPEYRAALVKYIQLSARTRSESIADEQLSSAEQKALSESTDVSGGFLVPPDIQAEMLVRTADKSVMRQNARVVPTSRDIVVFPRVQGKAAQGSIYSSGFVGGWVGETPTFTDTDPAFGQFSIAVKKARTTTRLSNDFIADAAVNVLSFLATNGAENLALV